MNAVEIPTQPNKIVAFRIYTTMGPVLLTWDEFVELPEDHDIKKFIKKSMESE